MASAPLIRQVRWFTLSGPAYQETPRSELLNLSAVDLANRIDRPS